MPQKRKLVEYSDTESEDDSMPALSPQYSVQYDENSSDVINDDAPSTSYDVNNFYTLESQGSQNMPKFKTTGTSYRLRFRNMETSKNIRETMEHVFQRVVQEIKQNSADGDLIGFYLHQKATMDKPMTLPYCMWNELSADIILSNIERIEQSRRELTFDDDIFVKFVRIASPRGGTRPKFVSNLEQRLKKLKSIVTIRNKDNICCARALIVAKALADKDKQYATIRNPNPKSKTNIQYRRAKDLMKQAGIDPDNTIGCGVAELIEFQRVLYPKYQIKVWCKEEMNNLIFEGDMASLKLNLYLHDNHYDVITSLPGFFKRSYWCDSCNKGFNNRYDHRCSVRCKHCFSPQQCINKNWIHCSKCNLNFPNEECLKNHKSVKPGHKRSVCSMIKRCKECNIITISGKRKHECGMYNCKTCHQNVKKGDMHQCFIQNVTPVEGSGKFIFFDFETSQQESIVDNGKFEHLPMLCVAQRVCHDCRNTDNFCLSCRQREHIFNGIDCLEKFCQWLFSPENKGCTAIAHNSKGFDGQFILKYMHKNAIKPDVVPKGLELMAIEGAGVKIIDSYNFLPMPLSKFPKTFGESELKKGFFPHFFNKVENWTYIGKLPPPKDYGYDEMKLETREEFLHWHKENSKFEFNFQKELLAYCRSDVDILRRCTMKFRDLFINTTTIDPFSNSLTIASACNVVYRSNFLPENIIGVIPYGGYEREKQQSAIGLKWIRWISHSQKIPVRHAGNGKEVKVGVFKVDGQCKCCRKNIYEFYGCYWHGCPKCFPNRKHTINNGEITMSEAYQRTIDRRRFLKNKGFNIIDVWECELTTQLKQNDTMRKFFLQQNVPEPINPRDAFFGGRTNATQLYFNASENKKAFYIDVCSLYPFICKYGRFPIGHPEIITENFLDINNGSQPYDGLIKCSILPPSNLLHPILPYRVNNKLVFPLCSKCSMEKSRKCNHDTNERQLEGTWVSLEIYKAIEAGYKIIKIEEVWHYHQYAKYQDIKSFLPEGLFTEYMDAFIKIKQEADGWPASIKTIDEKINYVNEWLSRENVKLDPDAICKNPGLRALAKLCLNSFWGKFGQRSNMMKTTYFRKANDYYKFVFDRSNIIHSVQFVNDRMVYVNYTHENNFVDILPNTNVVIAAFVTAQARLKLYSYIEQLQDRVLYFDTDSLIYTATPNQLKIQVGSFLGDMTNELRDFGESAYIREFVSAGPKNYAYKVYVDDEVVQTVLKIRGFRMTYNALTVLNFDIMKDIVHATVQSETEKSVDVNYRRIIRTKTRDVLTVDCSKKYKMVYDKRIILPNFSTVPFGYMC